MRSVRAHLCTMLAVACGWLFAAAARAQPSAADLQPATAAVQQVATDLQPASAAGGQQTATDARPPKVLAFFTAAGELDHVLFAQQAIRALTANAASHGYRFAATTDWDALADATLHDVAIVVWLNDQPRTPAQRAAFERYMNGGGAWLGFHVSGFAGPGWPWYREFLGGSSFGANNWPSLPARVNVDDPAHPVMKEVPLTFVAPINEWYSWNPSPRTNPSIKVLLTLDPSNFPLGVKNVLSGGDVPVAWTNTKYKMLYLNYGHGDRIFTSPILATLIDNSLQWLRSSQR